MAGKRQERTKSQEDVLKHPSTKRAKAIDKHEPMSVLEKHMNEQKVSQSQSKKNVLHWFRSKDLRAEDNKALAAASDKAHRDGATLLSCFLWSPSDLEWHGTSPARSDFMLESLRILQKQLQDELNIPLVVLTSTERGEKASKVLEFISKHDIGHVFANIEYEVDELRRDIDMFKQKGDDFIFHLFHDQTVMEPGKLKSGGGGPVKVYTPYHKAWLAEIAKDSSLLDLAPLPKANDKSVKTAKETKDLFSSAIPALPKSKEYSSNEHRDKLRKLWPPGHAAGLDRLKHFLSDKIDDYAATRSNPAKDSSSRLSPYFASGIISVREALSEAAKVDNPKKPSFDFSETSASAGVYSWVRELVFREFYRHTIVHSPHDAMNLPHNLKFDFVQWEDDEEGWNKWCNGTTGSPFVDAGMRQLQAQGWMHNRLRMNTASYLRCNLLLDYRRGERWFAENLVDWDLSNNTNGWEPSYTVFNPVSQAERNDPDGDYIRRWVPELKDVQGKAVFDPYHRLDKKEFAKLGYPEPHVDFAESKARCTQRYKQAMADADP